MAPLRGFIISIIYYITVIIFIAGAIIYVTYKSRAPSVD